MKRLLLAGLALAFVVGMAAPSFAATATVDITVTVTTGSVTVTNIGNPAVAIGLVLNGTSRTSYQEGGNSGRGIFQNNGDSVAQWQVTASNFTNWTLLTTGQAGDVTGAGVCRLSGIWTQWDRATIVLADFVANDRIENTTLLWSDLNQWALDGEPVEPLPGSFTKGFNIAPLGQRSMYFAFDAPTTVAAATADQCTVTVTAQLQP